MSGFHYHEFQALNGLLDAAPQKVLRKISIQSGITVAGARTFNPIAELYAAATLGKIDACLRKALTL
jgi:hypothetical protein